MSNLKIRHILPTCAFLLAALPLSAQSWRSEYLKAEKAGQISTCNAYVAYTNASFVVRIYGEKMDFLFSRVDFTLPYDKVLGQVSFTFRDIDFVLLASTNPRLESDRLSTTDLLFMQPKKEDYGALYDALQQNSRFTIGFPNGDSYPVTLQGSSRALSGASTCWQNEQTGPLDNNPFEGNQSGGNPFTDGENGNNPFDGT